MDEERTSEDLELRERATLQIQSRTELACTRSRTCW